MADEGDSKARNIPSLVALVLLAASAIVVKQIPYTSSRPEGTEKATVSPRSPLDVAARLWQDPFAAVDQHHREAARDFKDGVAPEEPDLLHRPEGLAAAIARNGLPLVVMPVFTFGGPYTDDAENRRRVRYAVLSGLGLSSYRFGDTRRIGYVQMRTGPLSVVPYEVLHSSALAQDLLVLWIDEDALGPRPLGALAATLSELLLCQRQVRERHNRPAELKIIGPQTSSAVEGINGELAAHASGNCYDRAELYTLSTAADIPPDLPELKHDNPLTRNGLSVLRTISKDRRVVGTLAAELTRRGIDRARDRIVLIGEWDTGYALRLLGSVSEALCVEDSEGEQRFCPDFFTYLRGLDGLVPSTLPKSASAGAPDAAPGSSLAGSQPSDGGRERASGNSQFDYLRRLSQSIREQESGTETPRRVRAIGVLGSDVYDKLLILQAMRETYPEALFFTTDLDASFLQPSEGAWARNLIVVSSFGLRLSDPWQDAIPPFRDSYQTAQFLAVQFALRSWVSVRARTGWPLRSEVDQAFLDKAMTPRIFEIGRTAAVDLSPADSDLHPPPHASVELAGVSLDHNRICFGLVALSLASVLLVLLSLRARAALRRVPGWFVRRPALAWSVLLGSIAATLVVGIPIQVALLLEGDGGEPFAWFEGISVWPTELLRLAAIILAVVFIVMVTRTMTRISETLGEDFFERISREPVEPPPPSQSSGWFESLFGISMRRADDMSDIDTETLWRRYRYRAALPQRVWRVALLTVVFDVFGFVVIRGVFAAPTVPARGGLSQTIDAIVLGVSIPVVTGLMFWVSDAIWLCLRFTREIGRPVPTGWPGELLSREAWNLAAPSEVLKAWLDMRFVGRWTAGLIQIVYYPAVVICLLILARSTVFDRWEPAPAGLVVIVLTSLGITIGCALSLRSMAERVRRNTRSTLVQYLLRLQGEKGIGETASVPFAPRGTAAQLERMLAEVEKMTEGAFAPLTQQPFVKAALLPLSSAGSVAAIEYLVLGH